MMAQLIFEIWQDEADSQQEMAQVSKRGDELRAMTMRGAVLVHSFTAGSDFEAFQKNYDWNGWGRWKPESDWAERFFSDAEAEEQRRYMAERNVR